MRRLVSLALALSLPFTSLPAFAAGGSGTWAGTGLVDKDKDNPTNPSEKLPHVGVVVYVSVNLDNAQADAIAGALGNALRQNRGAEVVAGEEVRRRLPASGVPEDCLVNSSCIKDVGRRLDASQILFLVIARVGARTQIDTTWADVASGRTVARDAVAFNEGNTTARDQAFASAAPRLLPDAPPRVVGQGNPKVIPPPVVASPPPRHLNAPVLVAVGLGTAALVGGVVLALGTRDVYNDLLTCSPLVLACQNEANTLNNQALYANILFGTAALAGVSALVFYIASGSAPTLSVSAARQGSGATLGGQF